MKSILTRLAFISLSLAFICLLTDDINAEIKPESIAGIWLLDEGQGDTVWDSSPNRNHGKFSDSKGIKWVDGKFGKALEFDGTDYVIIKHSPSLDQNDVITIALWFKGNSIGNYPSLIYKGTVGEPGYWGLHEMPDSNLVYVRIDTAGGINQTSGRMDNVVDEEWHHIVFVLDNGVVRMFRDGEALPEIAFNHGDGFGNNDELGIGSGFYPQDPRALDGVIDEVGIFNLALTLEDVQNIMDNGFKKALGASISVDTNSKLEDSWGNLKIQN